MKRGFRETTAHWGRCLSGRDRQPEFTAAARFRLSLAALARGVWPREVEPSCDAEAFAQVSTGCGLSGGEAIAQATHVIVNPPFNAVPAPRGCEWTSGSVCAAALFLDQCLQNARAGTRIVAILPDVLRSGNRYRLWRSRVMARATVGGTDLIGQFDQWADVDVFLLDLTVTRTQENRPDCWGYPCLDTGEGETVGSFFHVSVGPVVPFRHPERGPSRPYLHARGVPAWEVFGEVRERRRFEGTVHAPPFVVVRRTSRVGDKHRAVATVIAGGEPVAVENHLLVLRPKDGRLASCRRLLRSLRSGATDEWLNRRIRCRHLTVAAVRQIPLGEIKP